jgi:hypothetical protein
LLTDCGQFCHGNVAGTARLGDPLGAGNRRLVLNRPEKRLNHQSSPAAVRSRSRAELKFRSVPLECIADEHAQLNHVWQDSWEQEQLNRAVAATRDAYAKNHTFQAFERYVINGEPAERVAAAWGMAVNTVYKAKEGVSLALRAQLEALQHEEG